MTFRTLKYFIKVGVYLSLVISALIFFLVIKTKTYSYEWQIDPDGIKFFLSNLLPFSAVFKLTFSLIGVFLIIDQIDRSAHQKNMISLEEWQDRVINKLSVYEESNPAIYNHFQKNLTEIYKFISNIGFRIENKRKLKRFMKVFVLEYLDEFEELSIGFKNYEGIYEGEITSFARDDIQEILLLIVSPDIHYKKCWVHFEQIYNRELRIYKNNKGIENKWILNRYFRFFQWKFDFKIKILKQNK